jgi:eukaryotic-like serine/threonine-protein kinase
MAFQTRMWGVGRVVVLATALVSTYVVFAAAAARIALRVREVPVPDLRGRTVNGATAALASFDLSLRVDGARRTDTKTAADLVASQDPPAGTTARRGRSVRVWLSAGAGATAIPRLVGESERTAELRLERDGIEVAAVSEIRSNDEPAGVVVAQEPAAGTRAARVALLVNRGDHAASYVMPDLIGIDGERAASRLRISGFRVSVVAEHPYPGVPPGIVLRQAPQSGFRISPGELISLEVSR